MEFKTRISKLTENDVIIRNKKLSALVEKNSFSDAIFLLLRDREPTTFESQIFSAILISIIDHGAGTTSSLTTRFVTSTGNSLNTAVGAGVLALGDYHGGAIENAMNELKKINDERIDIETYVTTKLDKKETLFGYGHPIYKNEDPRVIWLLSLCKKLNYSSPYITTAQHIEQTLEKIKEKKICLNIDGLIAALLLAMGFKPYVGKGIFIIGRVPGLVAQSIEEKEYEKPVRRIEEQDINYITDNQ